MWSILIQTIFVCKKYPALLYYNFDLIFHPLFSTQEYSSTPPMVIVPLKIGRVSGTSSKSPQLSSFFPKTTGVIKTTVHNLENGQGF